jgi:hypothetical protein
LAGRGHENADRAGSEDDPTLGPSAFVHGLSFQNERSEVELASAPRRRGRSLLIKSLAAFFEQKIDH